MGVLPLPPPPPGGWRWAAAWAAAGALVGLYRAGAVGDALTTAASAAQYALLMHTRRQRPSRIILVRHGESLGNVDKRVYETLADSRLPLTPRGVAQARAAGGRLRALIGGETVFCFVSPYVRAAQTLAEMVDAAGLSPASYRVRYDPRLREQDFGNLQQVDTMRDLMATRKEVGRFFFRFPNGESGADVYDRVTSFLSSVFRVMDKVRSAPPHHRRYDNILIVSHGLTMRIICMRFLHWGVEQLEDVWNPDNGEVWVLERHPDTARYVLSSPVVCGQNRDEVIPVCMRSTPSSALDQDVREGDASP